MAGKQNFFAKFVTAEGLKLINAPKVLEKRRKGMENL